MSRIGKQPIKLPSGVNVKLNNSHVSVSGKKGKLDRNFHPDMRIALDNGILTVSRPSDTREHEAGSNSRQRNNAHKNRSCR